MVDLEKVYGSYEAIDKAKRSFEDDRQQLQQKLEKTKNMVYNSESDKQEAIEEVKQKLEARKQKYNDQLDKGYLKEVEKITSNTGFGEGDSTETLDELDERVLKNKSKTEIKLLANKYSESGNYEGQRMLNDLMLQGKIPVVSMPDFEPVEKKINELDKYYKGKKRVATDSFGAEKIRLSELKEEVGLI